MPRSVLHVASGSLPRTVGGTEIYVNALSRALLDLDWLASIVINESGPGAEPRGRYEYEGVTRFVLPAVPNSQRRDVVYSVTPSEAPGFGELLKELRPDVVHLHDFSPSAGLLHLRLACDFGATTVMTYHSPGQSCLQRSLLYRGRSICDGEILDTRCSECRLVTAGIPRPAAILAASIPRRSRSVTGDTGLVNRMLTARATTKTFRTAWEEMVERIDGLIVHSHWAADVLMRNGVPASKTEHVEPGLAVVALRPNVPRQRKEQGPLRVALPGRCDPVKGIHILIEAVLSLDQSVPLDVHLLGPYWDSPYGMSLAQRIEGDPRFRPPRLVQPSEMVATLGQMDLCVVPSLWLETGPLAVLEAFAAGVPVLGSSLGGIAERVTDGLDGRLFPPGDVPALAALLRDFATDRPAARRLGTGVQQPRMMKEVASETAGLYDEFASRR